MKTGFHVRKDSEFTPLHRRRIALILLAWALFLLALGAWSQQNPNLLPHQGGRGYRIPVRVAEGYTYFLPGCTRSQIERVFGESNDTHDTWNGSTKTGSTGRYDFADGQIFATYDSQGYLLKAVARAESEGMAQK